MKGFVNEIFSSVQGEGPWVGVRQLFVRFAGCHRHCRYCDTMRGCVDQICISGEYDPSDLKNPLGVEQLIKIIRKIERREGPHRHLVITGGEPLLQSYFLRELLPALKADGFGIYLETAGDHPRDLTLLSAWLDIVALDFKIRGATGQAAKWDEHREFLKLAQTAGLKVFVKLVVDSAVRDSELERVAEIMIASGAREIPLILQPVTKNAGSESSSTAKTLLRWQQKLEKSLPDVRIIPQSHKLIEGLK